MAEKVFSLVSRGALPRQLMHLKPTCVSRKLCTRCIKEVSRMDNLTIVYKFVVGSIIRGTRIPVTWTGCCICKVGTD